MAGFLAQKMDHIVPVIIHTGNKEMKKKRKIELVKSKSSVTIQGVKKQKGTGKFLSFKA